MTDAQHLFNFARRQFNEIADDVERHFDLVADQLRDWIPAGTPFARRLPPPKQLPPATTLQLATRWISRHRALSAAILAFAVTGSVGAIIYTRETRHKRRRRARKSPSGARTDVVVVAGAVANPLTSAVYLDLERRGFVVYVVANTHEDETYIRSQSRIDLLPLQLDLVDPYQAEQQMARFRHLLARDHRVFEDAEPHRLRFCGLVLVPDTPSGPVGLPAAQQQSPMRIGEVSSEEWSHALNAKVLNTIATTQLLLPALLEHRSRVLLLTPSVTPVLRPPGHAIESTIYGALEGFIASLAAEVTGQGVGVSHFKLGNFDIPAVTAKLRREGGLPSQAGAGAGRSSRLVATPVRRLHEAVFDALVASRAPARTWHVGRGSLTYDFIGAWMPAGLVGWMMGWTRRSRDGTGVADGDGVREEDLQGSAGSLTWEKVEQEV